MDGQRARLATPTIDRLPPIPRATPAPARPADRRLTRPWAAALGLGWPLTIVASESLAPAPADAAATVPPFVVLATLGFLVALVVTAVAAGLRHPSAAVAGVVTGFTAVTFTVACPVSGHHAIGAWWFGQLALTVAMLAVSAAALGRRAYTRA